MTLYIEVRTSNVGVVAVAEADNTTAQGSVSDYEGRSCTERWGSTPTLPISFEIHEHDRNTCVWRLVAKIAETIADQIDDYNSRRDLDKSQYQSTLSA